MELGTIAAPEEQAAATVVKKTPRSWVVLGRGGSSRVVDMDKHAILRHVGIHARDLRILDPFLSYPSAIMGRERAIVINLEHVKAIITAEEIWVRDPADDSVVPVIKELQRRLAAAESGAICEAQADDDDIISPLNEPRSAGEENEFPFEFRALEVILEGTCSFLDARTTELEHSAYPALDELTSELSSRNLDKVRKLKSAMTRLTNRIQKVRDELEQLLDDDGDMQDLYLSRKLINMNGSSQNGSYGAASPTIGSRISRASRTASIITTYDEDNDVEELEMLLEAYFMQVDASLNKLTTLREYIDDTEDYINIQLDNNRNQLIQLELCLNSAIVALSIYALVTAIFGMNIPYTWNQDHPHIFKWVVIFTGISSAVIFSCIMIYAKQKGLVGP